jgi:ribosomal protein S18 acetylase RimI-like enzyme
MVGMAHVGNEMDILKDFSHEDLTKAIHDSWNSMMRLFASSSLYERLETPELTAISSDLEIPMFNRVIATNLSSEDADERIMETVEYFSSKGLPFTWQVDPGNAPPDLQERLERFGLVRSETPGMAVVIDDVKTPEPPRGFRLERVETPEQNRRYARLLVHAYGIPQSAEETMTGIYEEIGIRDDLHHYFGFLEDTPVATATVLYSNGVAGIYNVATLPEARGKGIGSMITALPLIDARERGYTISVLHSSEMGYNVYRRLGYEETCRLIRYGWNP